MRALLLLILLPSGVTFCATLHGRVIDSQTREPLTGANVVIAGTQLGGASDTSGYFRIPNLEAGTFCVRASFVGYTTHIDSVVIATSNQDVELSFELSYNCEPVDNPENGDSGSAVFETPWAYRDSLDRLAHEGHYSPAFVYWFRRSLIDLSSHTTIPGVLDPLSKKVFLILDSNITRLQLPILSKERPYPISFTEIDSMATAHGEVRYIRCDRIYIDSMSVRALWQTCTSHFSKRINRVVHFVDRKDEFRYHLAPSGWKPCGQIATSILYGVPPD